MNQQQPRIQSVHVKNYRALRDLKLTSLNGLTVLVGANGAGKSTLFDVFAFLSECFDSSLKKALNKRGNLKELRTRGQTGPVSIEVKYKRTGQPVITYFLEVDEEGGKPVVAHEKMSWRRKQHGKPFDFLRFKKGEGDVVSGSEPDESAQHVPEKLNPDALAVTTLGQFEKHPLVADLRNFILDWHMSYLNVDLSRQIVRQGPAERLDKQGENLPNVVQYYHEEHPAVLERVLAELVRSIPQLSEVSPEVMLDGRLMLKFRDQAFTEPVIAEYVSDGTLKMLAYLLLFHDPNPPSFICIEEPENHLSPHLMPRFAEICYEASKRTQLFITTHEPELLNHIRLEDAWIVERDKSGFTHAKAFRDIHDIKTMYSHKHAALGNLWLQGYAKLDLSN